MNKFIDLLGLKIGPLLTAAGLFSSISDSTPKLRLESSELCNIHRANGRAMSFSDSELLPHSSKSSIVRPFLFLYVALALGCASRARPQAAPAPDDVSVIPGNSVELNAHDQAPVGSFNPSKGIDIIARQSSDALDSDSILTEVIGLPVASAERLAQLRGKRFRVVKIDGEHLTITADSPSDRLSVEVVNGNVVSARWY